MDNKTNDQESVLEIISSLKKTINSINAITFAGLGFTTFLTAYFIARQKLLGADVPIWVVSFASLLIPFIIYTLFDSGLRKWLIVSLKAIISPSFRSAEFGVKTLAISLVFVAFVRFGLTTCATVFSGYIAGDEMVEDNNTDDIEKMYIEKEKAAIQIDVSTSKEISTIRQTAKVQAAAVIDDAKAKGSKKWQKLYNQKNGWFISGGKDTNGNKNKGIVRYIKGIEKAKKESAKILADAEKRIAEMNDNKLAILKDKSSDKNLAAIAGLKIKQAEKNEAKEMRITFGLLTADIVLSIIAFLTSFLIAKIMTIDPSFAPFRDSDIDLSEIPHQASELAKKMVNNTSIALIKLVDLILNIVPVSVVKMHAATLTVETGNKTGNNRKQKQETIGNKTSQSNKGGGSDRLSNKGSSGKTRNKDKQQNTKIKYVNMKRDIERIKRVVSYNARRYKKTGNNEYLDKINDIMSDKNRGVAWLENMGFECTYNEKEGKLLVRSNN
jgi:hypothetical protein